MWPSSELYLLQLIDSDCKHISREATYMSKCAQCHSRKQERQKPECVFTTTTNAKLTHQRNLTQCLTLYIFMDFAWWYTWGLKEQKETSTQSWDNKHCPSLTIRLASLSLYWGQPWGSRRERQRDVGRRCGGWKRTLCDTAMYLQQRWLDY